MWILQILCKTAKGIRCSWMTSLNTSCITLLCIDIFLKAYFFIQRVRIMYIWHHLNVKYFKSRMFHYHAAFFCSIYSPNTTFVFYYMSNVIWHVFFVITPRNTYNKCSELEVGICLKSRLINNQVDMQTNDARKSSLRRIVHKQIPKSLKNCTTNVYNPGIKVNISVVLAVKHRYSLLSVLISILHKLVETIFWQEEDS